MEELQTANCISVPILHFVCKSTLTDLSFKDQHFEDLYSLFEKQIPFSRTGKKIEMPLGILWFLVSKVLVSF